MGALRTFPWVLVRSWRLIPWWHLGLGLVAAVALAATRRNPYPDDLVFGLRVAAIALAASATFVFDDPAANVMDGKPVPPALQRIARLSLALPAIVVGWLVLLGWMEAGLGPIDERAMETLPRLDLSLEFAALLGIGWAVATLATRTGQDPGGNVAALTLLAIVVILILLPERWSLFPSPANAPLLDEAASPQWEAWIEGHRRWAVLAVTAWAGVALGLVGSTRRQWLTRRHRTFVKDARSSP